MLVDAIYIIQIIAFLERAISYSSKNNKAFLKLKK